MNNTVNSIDLTSSTGSLHFELRGDRLFMDHMDIRGSEVTVYSLPVADFLSKLGAPYVHLGNLIAKLHEVIDPLPPWPESWPE